LLDQFSKVAINVQHQIDKLANQFHVGRDVAADFTSETSPILPTLPGQ
jgi:hypothetical protein